MRSDPSSNTIAEASPVSSGGATSRASGSRTGTSGRKGERLMTTNVLGRLVGNTGDPTNLSMVLNSSFAGKRGEFVRVRHHEHENGPATDVLARIVSISRSNVLYNSGLGQAVTELELLPGGRVTGEQV